MTTAAEIWSAMDLKLIAILRGIQPEETRGVVESLLEEGFRAIEIPLNSPRPLESIEIAVQAAEHHPHALVGAGTVLDQAQVRELSDVGANLVVSPNVDASVATPALTLGMATFPGVFTATEAHAAVKLGATGLKFFPGFLLGPSGINAIRATLPPTISIAAVGGVGVGNFAEYRKAGIHAFGLGSNLYRPGDNGAAVRSKARAIVEAFKLAGEA